MRNDSGRIRLALFAVFRTDGAGRMPVDTHKQNTKLSRRKLESPLMSFEIMIMLMFVWRYSLRYCQIYLYFIVSVSCHRVCVRNPPPLVQSVLYTLPQRWPQQSSISLIYSKFMWTDTHVTTNSWIFRYHSVYSSWIHGYFTVFNPPSQNI